MKRFSTFLVMLIAVFAIVLSGCSSDRSDGGGLPSNPNAGSDNYTDVAVTGGLQEVGITYADLLGYVNYPEGEEYNLPVGILYGEKEDELTERAYGENVGRKIKVTARGLKPNTKYYYKTFVGTVDYRFVGKQIASFTTKKAEFNGGMTATASDITFKQVKISYNVDVGSLSEKEIYEIALVCSTKPFSLTPREMLQKFMNKDGDGYNGDLYFIQVDNRMVNLTSPPESTIYYSVFLTIGGELFMSKVQNCPLRVLPVESDFVDLGLSCDWASTNLGCESPFEFGSEVRLNKVDAIIESRYGKGYSLPTEEQVRELNSCHLEVIDNGVLVTGPNGKQIYIPMTNGYGSGKDYGTCSIKTEGGGSGAYQHWSYYSILFSINSDGTFSTHKSVSPYYDSLMPGYGSYSNCYIRVVRNK